MMKHDGNHGGGDLKCRLCKRIHDDIVKRVLSR